MVVARVVLMESLVVVATLLISDIELDKDLEFRIHMIQQLFAAVIVAQLYKCIWKL